MEAEHGAVAVGDDLLVVGIDEEREHRAVDAEGGLDHMGRVARAVLLDPLELVPDAFVCAVRSKSPRLATPSSSDQPIGNRYSMSLVPLE